MVMQIRADLTQRAVVQTHDEAWTPSPQKGVDRKMLDRDGAEVARATSLVRFAAGSDFPEHEHGAGEELLVVEGVFSDEAGDYPAGTYVRHPPGSRHRSFSRGGCVIFVKLRQMTETDDATVVVDTAAAPWRSCGGGLHLLPLYENTRTGERVSLRRFDPGAVPGPEDHPGGTEMLVLDGVLQDEHGRYPAGTWLRLPAGGSHAPSSTEGCRLWVKTGHLRATSPPAGA
jgi:anti-sigma factor ChrR (cupin superfamily)